MSFPSLVALLAVVVGLVYYSIMIKPKDDEWDPTRELRIIDLMLGIVYFSFVFISVASFPNLLLSILQKIFSR